MVAEWVHCVPLHSDCLVLADPPHDALSQELGMSDGSIFNDLELSLEHLNAAVNAEHRGVSRRPFMTAFLELDETTPR